MMLYRESSVGKTVSPQYHIKTKKKFQTLQCSLSNKIFESSDKFLYESEYLSLRVGTFQTSTNTTIYVADLLIAQIPSRRMAFFKISIPS